MTTDVTRASEPLTAGFIGGGFMASVHSRSVRAARGRLAGIATSSLAKAEIVARDLGFDRAYADPAELIGAVDLVHVVTPNGTHADFARAALAARRHVICEKPLATTTEDARALAEAADAAGVLAAVPFVYRYHPMVREARARVARGDAGRLLTIHGSYLQDWLLSEDDDDWRVDTRLGGPSRAFADIGSHLCDLVEFVTGDRITRLVATKSTAIPARALHRDVLTEDAVAVVVQTSSGAIGTLLVSQVAPGRKNRLAIEIAGSVESIAFDQEQPETLWLGRRAGSQLLMRETGSLSPDAARLSILPAGHALGYQDAFNAFMADAYAVAAGAEREGLPTFADGLRAAVLTDAVLESSATGQWIEVVA
jgi:predicted dehydrogenase